MAVTSFYDRVQMSVSGTPGTGTITLGSAVTTYRAFPAAADGKTVTYLATDGSASEVGKGVYTHSGTTLTRGTLEWSSTGSAISLTSAAVISCDFSAVDAGRTSGPRAPEGRLSLTTGVAVMAADATAQATVYYVPYNGSMVPIFAGSSWLGLSIGSQISLTLNSTDNTNTNLYDIFVFSNSGTATLGTGPAWSSGTARGTGAGTTELELKDGIWTNKNTITLRAAGSSLGSQAANTCTYLGTFYCTANGQTGVSVTPAAASGGSAPFVAISNGYNRVPASMLCQDNKATWTYNSTTWRMSDNSASNSATWVDGLQQSPVAAFFQVYATAAASSGADIGLYLDATSGTPLVAAEASNAASVSFGVRGNWRPQLGKHFVQGAEAAATAVSQTFFGLAGTPARQLHSMTVDITY